LVLLRIRSYAPAALIAGLFFYFGVNAMIGDRGLLTHARRDAELAQKQRILSALRQEHARLALDAKLLSTSAPSRDFIEEEAQTILGYADPRDYVIRRND
jgi:cell division protein FtsB